MKGKVKRISGFEYVLSYVNEGGTAIKNKLGKKTKLDKDIDKISIGDEVPVEFEFKQGTQRPDYVKMLSEGGKKTVNIKTDKKKNSKVELDKPVEKIKKSGTQVKFDVAQKKIRQDEFLNPYNFIDIDDFTPKYRFTSFENFKGESGYIDVEMELQTPLFIGGEKKEIEVIDEKGQKQKHNQIDFYKISGKPVIPASSIKGMIRNRIEILSNSCFNHDYFNDDLLNYLSYRLDVEIKEDSKEIRNLKTGVLVKKNGEWRFIKLDNAKVLTVIDRRFKDKQLGACFNKRTQIPEKISSNKNDGLEKYNLAKRWRCDNKNVFNYNASNDGYSINNINNQQIPEKELNKTFALIDLSKKHLRLFGIVRYVDELRKNKYKKFPVKTFKLKAVSDNIETLKDLLSDYNKNKSVEEKKKKQDKFCVKVNDISYSVCELFLKTSYDIETKTQDKVLFIFGEQNLSGYIDKTEGIKIDDTVIKKFRNVIKTRYNELDKHHPHDYLFKMQPKDIHNMMGVYANIHHDSVEYLSYTEISRKPYKWGINDIISKMKKDVCSDLDALCPACNIFGFISNKKALAGKLFFENGNITVNNGLSEYQILKPLSTPKPTFHEFYLTSNRKNSREKFNYSSDIEKIKIGRKFYLFHPEQFIDYIDQKKTKLNSSIRTLKKGSKFKFRIDYWNMNKYELGLLLYSLKTEFQNYKVDFILGMGKPYGLGRLSMSDMEVTVIDREKRYSSLLELGSRKLKDSEISNYINIFKNIQVQSNQRDFDSKLVEYNKNDIADTPDNLSFFDIVYVKEFIYLSLLNQTGQKLPVKYPAKYNDQNELVGFEWFKQAKNNNEQRLFNPQNITDNKANICLSNFGR